MNNVNLVDRDHMKRLPLLAFLALGMMISLSASAGAYLGPYVVSSGSVSLSSGQSVTTGSADTMAAAAWNIQNPPYKQLEYLVYDPRTDQDYISFAPPVSPLVLELGPWYFWRSVNQKYYIEQAAMGNPGWYDDYDNPITEVPATLTVANIIINSKLYGMTSYSNTMIPGIAFSPPPYTPPPLTPISVTYNVPNHDDFVVISEACGITSCASGSASIKNITNPAPGLYTITEIPQELQYPLAPSTCPPGMDYYQMYACANSTATLYWETQVAISVQVYTPTIPKASVLVVAMGKSDGMCNSAVMQSYNSVLVKQGLGTPLCVDLDDDMYTNLTGQLPSVGSWQSIKTEINTLEAGSGAQYLVILGDATVIPMPDVVPNGATTITGLKDIGAPNLIPTDDPYGSLDPVLVGPPAPGEILYRPTIAVGRIPGSSTAQINQFLQDDINERKNTNAALGIFTDTSIEPDLNMLTQGQRFSTSLTGTSCLLNLDCYLAPPFCLSSSSPLCTMPHNSINRYSSLLAAQQAYDLQIYNCHGSGFSCGDPNWKNTIIASGSIPNLITYPVVMIVGCFDGAIPGISDYAALSSYYAAAIPPGATSLPVALLNGKASVVIGTTVTFQAVDQVAIFENKGETIGMAFLSEKNILESDMINGDSV